MPQILGSHLPAGGYAAIDLDNLPNGDAVKDELERRTVMPHSGGCCLCWRLLSRRRAGGQLLFGAGARGRGVCEMGSASAKDVHILLWSGACPGPQHYSLSPPLRNKLLSQSARPIHALEQGCPRTGTRPAPAPTRAHGAQTPLLSASTTHSVDCTPFAWIFLTCPAGEEYCALHLHQGEVPGRGR